jgi:type III pantothenate kinase
MSEQVVHLLAISVGNSTTRFGRFVGNELQKSHRVPNADAAILIERLVEAAVEMESAGVDRAAIVLASVNEPVAELVASGLRDRADQDVYRLGSDLEIPLRTALLPHATPGQDRLLNALAAFDRMKKACVVVDCGTAVTVDFIDGQGVFQGGAIAPGASMSLHALHERTAALPHVHLARPNDADPFGRDTKEAMINGVFWGIRGLVRVLTERYAEAYEAYPPVIVTGGDAAVIFDGEDLIDRIVPDLTLMGIEAACRLTLGDGAVDSDDDDADETA